MQDRSKLIPPPSLPGNFKMKPGLPRRPALFLSEEPEAWKSGHLGSSLVLLLTHYFVFLVALHVLSQAATALGTC